MSLLLAQTEDGSCQIYAGQFLNAIVHRPRPQGLARQLAIFIAVVQMCTAFRCTSGSLFRAYLCVVSRVSPFGG